jgi:hypothetical protein
LIDRNAVKTLKHFNLPRDDSKDGQPKKELLLRKKEKTKPAKSEVFIGKKMGRPPRDRTLPVDPEKKQKKLKLGVEGIVKKKKSKRGPIMDEEKLELQRKRMAIAREALRKKREAKLLELSKAQQPKDVKTPVEQSTLTTGEDVKPSLGVDAEKSSPKPGSPVQLKIVPYSTKVLRKKMREKLKLRKRKVEGSPGAPGERVSKLEPGRERVESVVKTEAEDHEPINLDEDEVVQPRQKRPRRLSVCSTRSSSVVEKSPLKKPNDDVEASTSVLPTVVPGENVEEAEEPHPEEDDVEEDAPAETNVRVVIDVPPSLATILVRDQDECCGGSEVRCKIRVKFVCEVDFE